MTTHFWLGGSIAKRALACPGSLQYRSSGSSAAADRGTLLHDAMTRLTTGEIECRQKKVYRITVRFAGSEIRRG